MIEGKPLEELDSFICLGSITDTQRGTDTDVKTIISKAKISFLQLKKIRGSRDLPVNTKISYQFNTIENSVLLYGAEKWITTITMTKRIQTFVNNCLRRIFRIRWPDKISNEKLWQRTKQKLVGADTQQRCWRWIGHTLRKPTANIKKQFLR